MASMNQTQQQVAELRKALEREAHRVGRWAIYCLIFALATSALAIATKSLVFIVVALFAWFFVWNRWRLWRFLVACFPPPSENQAAWLEKTVEGLLKPPSWYRLSEHIAAVTFLVCFGIITVVVMSTSGTWMRLLYGMCWLLIGIVVVFGRIVHRGQKRKDSTAS
jgi:hypothetical protein